MGEGSTAQRVSGPRNAGERTFLSAPNFLLERVTALKPFRDDFWCNPSLLAPRRGAGLI